MTGPLKRIAGAVSLLALLAGAPTAFAQTGRPWIDPPSDAAGTPPPAAQTPSPSTAAPVTTGVPSRQEKAVLPEAAEPQRENARARSPVGAGSRAAANPSSPRKAAETARIRRSPTRSAAARTKATNGPRRAMASNRSNAAPNGRPRGAERLSRESVRSARVRDAVNAGLEVMSLQTIELPDGRRIDVLVRPNPRTLSRLMDEPL